MDDIKIEYGSFGNHNSGTKLYLVINHGRATGIRISELEACSKYNYNGNMNLFTFNSDNSMEFIDKLSYNTALKNIPQVKKWVDMYYPKKTEPVLRVKPVY